MADPIFRCDPDVGTEYTLNVVTLRNVGQSTNWNLVTAVKYVGATTGVATDLLVVPDGENFALQHRTPSMARQGGVDVTVEFAASEPITVADAFRFTLAHDVAPAGDLEAGTGSASFQAGTGTPAASAGTGEAPLTGGATDTKSAGGGAGESEMY